jgi:hypothetical protein
MLVGEGLERLRELLPEGLLVVADSALGHVQPLCQADRSGLRFIVPLRAVTGFRQRFVSEVGFGALRPLRYASVARAAVAGKRRTRYRGLLAPFAVQDPETGERRPFRVAYIHSSEEAREVGAAPERAPEGRGRAAAHRAGARRPPLQDQGPGRSPPRAGARPGRGPHRGAKRRARWPTDAGVATRRAGCRWGRCTDGVTALCTNLPGRLSAERVLRTYKQQWVVEPRHRDLKGLLKVRPVFLHNDDRIAALVSVIGLALLVFGLIESELRRRLGEGVSFPACSARAAPADPPGATSWRCSRASGSATPTRASCSTGTTTQRRILELLEVSIPWPEQGEPAAATCGRWS